MKSNTVVIIVVIVGVICCVLAGCVFCVALGLIGSQAGGFDFGGAPQIGEIAPDFELRTIDGESVALSDFRGQPVMINFWALWCGPCIEEMPLIQERFEQHHKELVVLAIEEGGADVSVQNYVSEAQFDFLVLAGTDAVFRQYNIYAYPTTIFIDTDGVIQASVIGGLSAAELDEKLGIIGVGE